MAESFRPDPGGPPKRIPDFYRESDTREIRSLIPDASDRVVDAILPMIGTGDGASYRGDRIRAAVAAYRSRAPAEPGEPDPESGSPLRPVPPPGTLRRYDLSQIPSGWVKLNADMVVARYKLMGGRAAGLGATIHDLLLATCVGSGPNAGQCTLGGKQIADRLGLSVSTVRTTMRRLISVGLIASEVCSDGIRRYVVYHG